MSIMLSKLIETEESNITQDDYRNDNNKERGETLYIYIGVRLCIYREI